MQAVGSRLPSADALHVVLVFKIKILFYIKTLSIGTHWGQCAKNNLFLRCEIMGYNVKVIKYDSEIQVNFYEHGVRVTDKHFMTDTEKRS